MFYDMISCFTENPIACIIIAVIFYLYLVIAILGIRKGSQSIKDAVYIAIPALLWPLHAIREKQWVGNEDINHNDLTTIIVCSPQKLIRMTMIFVSRFI